MSKAAEFKRCDYMTDDRLIIADNPLAAWGTSLSRDCLRPAGHEGAHLIHGLSGNLVAWRYDICPPEEECYGCADEDPNEWCTVYWPVDVTEGNWLRNSIRPIYTGTPEEWLAAGEQVLKSLPLAERKANLGRYFYCNVQDENYTIAADQATAGREHRAKHFLPSEGWPIFGVVIQEHHLE